MDDVRVVFEEIVEGLGELLQLRGFSSLSNETFVLREGDCAYRCSLTMLRPKIAGSRTLELSAGVCFLPVWAFLGECRLFAGLDKFSVAGCGGAHYGILPRGYEPSWTPISNQTDSVKCVESLRDDVIQYVLPFLEEHSNINRAISYWLRSSRRDELVAAAAMFLSGRKNDSNALLRSIEQNAKEEVEQSGLPADRLWFERVGTFSAFMSAE